MKANGSFRLSALAVLGLLLWYRASAQADWPVQFKAGDTEYQVFAPQPESMRGSQFTARAAVSIRRAQDKGPVFGAIWGDGVFDLDRGSRLGQITRFNVTDARFPGITTDQELAQIRLDLSNEIPQKAPPLSMDWMVSALEEERMDEDQYANDPPEIIYSEKPAALVFVDGDPIYEKMDARVAERGDPLYDPKSTRELERVVNTPFVILRTGQQHYLYGSRMWFRAERIDGPWRREDPPPMELQQLASKLEEGAALTRDDRPGNTTPEIIMRRTPAELLDVDGQPKFQPVQNTNLLTLTNSSRSVFMDIATQDYYFLASGRWFRTRDLAKGPWSHVPANQLPEEFRKIPEGSDRDMVLAHVAGTDAAREAVRDSYIPQTARVERKTASLEVTYQGAPAFERIAGTNVEQARNASTDVLRINSRYHACDNGVWYESDTPDGPWQVSTVVPAEVNEIPPSSSAYNLRYVYIYDHTPDIVYVGYTPGYMGTFIQHGVVIYGTGFYYQPWPGFWRPRPWTWGFNMYYDPWFGWGMGFGWGYNWFHPAWGMWHPWGGYGFGYGWWGPWGWHPPCCFTPHASYYGHRPSVTGRSGRSEANAAAGPGLNARSTDLYSAVGRAGVSPTTVQRNPDRLSNSASKGQPARTADHFTDAAGNVYRLDNGEPQRYENGGWDRVRPPVRENASSGQEPRTRPNIPQERQRTPDVPSPQRPTQRPGGQIDSPTNRTPGGTDPYQIQRDRQRGFERQRTFERSAPQRMPQQMRPPQQSRPGNVAPSAPSRPSPGMAPSGGGGGRGGGAPAGGGGRGGASGGGGTRGR